MVGGSIRHDLKSCPDTKPRVLKLTSLAPLMQTLFSIALRNDQGCPPRLPVLKAGRSLRKEPSRTTDPTLTTPSPAKYSVSIGQPIRLRNPPRSYRRGMHHVILIPPSSITVTVPIAPLIPRGAAATPQTAFTPRSLAVSKNPEMVCAAVQRSTNPPR